MSTDPRPTAIVSGASRGLGLAIADELIARGYRVLGFARRSTPETAAKVAASPASFAFVECDAANAAALEEVIGRAQSLWGRLDLLVNNAAIGQDSLLSHTSPARIAEILTTNLVAPLLLSRLAVRHMLLQPGGGHIISISSVCGRRGLAGLTVYSASKAGLEGFTRALAREVGGRGIRVNAIAPGFFESDMSAALQAEEVSRIRRRTATGRLVTQEDVLAALRFLLSPAVNVTGQVIVVDGGFTA